MAQEKIDRLEQKKRELEEELDKIQQELDDSIDKVRTDVSTRLHPAEIVKRYPLPVVGLSLLTGFLAGSRGSEKSSGEGFNTLLWGELKKIATKKGIALATEYLENVLLDDDSSISSQNGSVKKD